MIIISFLTVSHKGAGRVESTESSSDAPLVTNTSTSESHITPSHNFSHSLTTDSDSDTSILTTYLTAATTAAATTTTSNRAQEADVSQAPGMYFLLYSTLI